MGKIQTRIVILHDEIFITSLSKAQPCISIKNTLESYLERETWVIQKTVMPVGRITGTLKKLTLCIVHYHICKLHMILFSKWILWLAIDYADFKRSFSTSFLTWNQFHLSDKLNWEFVLVLLFLVEIDTDMSCLFKSITWMQDNMVTS